ncbi:MAG: histidine phosphatase family protein [Fibrobacter sp.]|nr:histidine phosphatase family protein [Fibrobacter sp.]
MKKIFGLLAAMCMFVACGGEDIPNGPPPIGSSSSVAAEPGFSSAGEPVPASSATDPSMSSSATTVPVVSGDYPAPFKFYNSPAYTGLALTPDADGFYDMGDVYKAVPKTSKIAFVIRHSKRQKSTGTESQLTPIGEQMAKDLGAKLVGDESFYYASTDFIRTRKTCELIAVGRGETANVVTWDGIDGGYFLTVPSDTLDEATAKSGGPQKQIARYAYGELNTTSALGQKLSTYFHDLYERGNQFVTELIVPNMTKWDARVSVLATHDVLTEPLIVFASNRTIDLKFYQSPFHWVNYLSGAAIILDENNRVTVLPTKGDTNGWMIPSQEIDESAN